jgi:pyridoxamine 5'-phosphate oxidase
MASRADFERRYQALAAKHEGGEVPRPPHWWGYRLAPERIEFWVDRAHRLHERRLFARSGSGWTESLLYP